VVGHDWGAAVAWALAAFVPDRIERLVAMSVGHPATRDGRTLEARRRAARGGTPGQPPLPPPAPAVPPASG
jgi:pimeloyl-ACP methyl ester carboxylesterase